MDSITQFKKNKSYFLSGLHNFVCAAAFVFEYSVQSNAQKEPLISQLVRTCTQLTDRPQSVNRKAVVLHGEKK